MSTSNTHVRVRTRRRIDPVLASALVLLAALAAWIGAPMATGTAIAPASGNLNLRLDVPVATSVTPGLTAGDTSVRLPKLALPGDPQDATSTGWKLSTNWANGYEVRIRSTSNPALRGVNAVDGSGAPDAFADFSTDADCPCPWSTTGSTKGVFGYSASVTGNGATVAGATKWGTSAARKWRGLNKSSYQLFSTTGGTNQYGLSLVFRSEIPQTAPQAAGSYRASFVISVSPLL
ncbi:MAG: hypothetical protein JWN72_1173 [Thermoleophilia bacterium]|nr:hypothetical protein [Thermoleophilia bacterium]